MCPIFLDPFSKADPDLLRFWSPNSQGFVEPFFFLSALVYRVEKGFKNGPSRKNLEGFEISGHDKVDI